MALALVKSAKGISAVAVTAPTFGSATTAGNLIVLVFASDDYNGTPDAGWHQSAEMEQQTFHGGYLWWRISTGETAFQYTIGSATVSAWVIAEFSGNAGMPYDGSQGKFTQATVDLYTTDTIIPSVGPRLLVAEIGGSKNVSNVGSPYTSWLNSFTEIQSNGTSAGATDDTVAMAYRLVTGDGSTTFSTGATYPVNQQQSTTGLIASFKESGDKVIFFLAADGTTFTIPSDWSAVNTIEVLASGGGGRTAASSAAGGGGGGGQYRKLTNVAGKSPGNVITVSVGDGSVAGANGADAWWDGASLGAATVGAQGGRGATSGTGAAGGSTGTGGTGFNGGTGGTGGATPFTGGGGGGAAGPGGAGGTGGAGDNTAAGADFGGGGGSGAGISTAGAAGTAGTTAAGVGGVNFDGGGPGGAGGSGDGVSPAVGIGVWSSTHLTDCTTTSVVIKSPGGGGGGDGSAAGGTAGTGQSYGGGGGGGGNAGDGGLGGPGIIIITYTPSSGAVSASPTGVNATGAANIPTVVGKANVTLTGLNATGAANIPTVSGKANVTLTGVNASGAANIPTVTGKANVTLTGVNATGAANTPTVTGLANVTLTGVNATGAANTPTVSVAISAAPTGVTATGAANTPTVTGAANVTLTGVNATGAANTPTVTGLANVTLTGVNATGTANTPTVTGLANVSVTGVNATGAANTVTVDEGVSGNVNVTLDGVAATGAADTPTVTGAANVTIDGVAASGAVGTPTVDANGGVVAGTQKDSDPDYWKLPWLHVEGESFTDRLRAKALAALEDAAESAEEDEPARAKRAARKAAKELKAYARAEGALLSDDLIQELGNAAKQLNYTASQWDRSQLLEQVSTARMALLAYEAQQQDEEDALLALMLVA